MAKKIRLVVEIRVKKAAIQKQQEKELKKLWKKILARESNIIKSIETSILVRTKRKNILNIFSKKETKMRLENKTK